jgi:glutaconate CoA-transferase subunit A
MMSQEAPFASLDELVARIGPGAMVAIPPEYCGVAMAATRALVRRGAEQLHLVGCPSSGLQADILIGAGCVATVEAAAITFGEFGPAPRFTRAVRDGSIAIKDSTCPAIHAGLQATEKGVPFMPLRGIIGSDLVTHRPEWKVIDNPLANNGDDPIVVLPAIAPDIALFHAALADRHGNVWVGRRRELISMAHAARETLVTVEAEYDGDLLADERMAAGTLPGLYVSAIAIEPRGAWPLAFAEHYDLDNDHMAEYVRLAASDDGFARYTASHIHSAAAA